MKRIIYLVITLVAMLTMYGCGSSAVVENTSMHTSPSENVHESVYKESVVSEPIKSDTKAEITTEEENVTHTCDVCGGAGTVPNNNVCPTCCGTGIENVWVNDFDGTGMVIGQHIEGWCCSGCAGSGHIGSDTETCPGCNGKGFN